MSDDALPPLSLYIHYPWCEKKCPYCDFNSHEAQDLPESAYIDALLADLQDDLPHLQNREVKTLFIGGGTPSLLSVANLKRLMQGIAEIVPLSASLEATMEANPGSADAKKFAGFRKAGINRLSLGVQSFNNDRLHALGRIHSAEQARAAIEMVRAAGFDNFNIDLMHGLPGQTADEAREDLETALSFKPPHLSWYQLTIEPNTVFYSKPPTLPMEDELADIQRSGETALAGAGLGQYEVSAYSRNEALQCRHNLNYWQFGDYLGIGAGAHGKVTMTDGRVVRYDKRRQPDEYLAAGSGAYLSNSRALEEIELPGEYLMNALRLNCGFELEHYSARTGLPPDSLQPQLGQLLEKNLLLQTGSRVRCTDLGRRFLDSVITEFLPD